MHPRRCVNESRCDEYAHRLVSERMRVARVQFDAGFTSVRNSGKNEPAYREKVILVLRALSLRTEGNLAISSRVSRTIDVS